MSFSSSQAAIGDTRDPAVLDPNANASMIAVLKGILSKSGGGGGAGGSSAPSDTAWVDNNGVYFVYRDTGVGTPVATRIDTWAAFTPTAPVKPAGGASSGGTVSVSNFPVGQASDANLTSIGSTNHSDLLALTAKVPGNLTAAGDVSALNAALSIAVGPQATVGIQVAGAGTGFTLQPQASMDGGTTWINVAVIQAGVNSTSTPQGTITASPGNYEFNAGGYSSFRLLNTGAATGTVTASFVATPAQKFLRSVGIGEQADAAAASDTASGSLISFIKRLVGKLPSQVAGRLPVDGSGVTQPVTEQNVRAGEDLAADTQHISDDGAPTYISTAATTLVASGRGVLKRIVLTETAAGTITVYDSTTATGTVIAVLKASVIEQTFECGFQFTNGLTVVTAAASKLTVVTGL